MAINNWQFFLAQSSDMSLIAEITNESFDKSLSLSKNRAGSLSLTLPFKTLWKDYLDPLKYCIVAQKNKQFVWSGPIWTKTENFGQGTIDISASGWFQILMKRFIIDADRQYTAQTDGAIALDLLNYANSQTIDAVVVPTWITAGSNSSASVRTQLSPRWSSVGQEIINLTELEAGFDFEINPTTRQMNISAWNAFTDRPNAIFAYNWGPENAQDMVRTTSADELGNQTYVLGTNANAESHDLATPFIYNLQQNIVNVNDVTNLGILAAISNAETAVNRMPRVLFDFTPLPESARRNVPKLFTDYNIGDKVYITAKRDGTSIMNQAVRLFGVTINIDNEGNESLSSIQTTYQSG